MDMNTVSASQFKAKMGRYMRAVQGGEEVVVTDRDRPVARLVPFERRDAGELRVASPRDPAAPPLGELEVRGLRQRGTETTALLREDRDRR